MFQVIGSLPLPEAAPTGRSRLGDPDLLLDIAEQMRRGDACSPELGDAFSLILHDLRMGGTWKRTNRGRLPHAQRMICTHVAPVAADDVTVLDLGASDGITTLELSTALRASFGERSRVYLTDLNLWLLRYRRGPFVEYRAANGEPVMARIGRVGLRLSDKRRHEEGGSDLVTGLYLKCRQFRRSMWLDTRISLVHPLVERDHSIVVKELDCLTRDNSLIDRFSAVRASNVLNVGYFTSAQMHGAIGNLHAYLREGGCLVVSRNEDKPDGERENGSIWRKAGQRFAHLADFGAGSEIKADVDGWSRP